ncbi:hypothetical protein GCM10020221_24740 [Streptomyces thioluteus]|uniref:Coenzyme F420 biosynthesis-associated protein n=1 Tax=Streptomyces thioluteus TaxID=66431 RepID=A0ABN3WX25_STRTU
MTSIGGAEMVDWKLAVATATRLVRPGPDVSREEARDVVAELRRYAKSSEEHVRSFTRMSPPGGPADDTPVLVVDRAGWIRANVAGFRAVLGPLLEKMQDRRGNLPGGAVLGAVGGKVTGVELGMLLSFLASRVLGQYETFAPATRELPGAAEGGGRLLLVAPNIVHVERELDVDPHDFRLWVCLHEETHRTQFTAVPWLRDHIEGEVPDVPRRDRGRPGHAAGSGSGRRCRRWPAAGRRRTRRRVAGGASSNWSRPRPSGRSSPG